MPKKWYNLQDDYDRLPKRVRACMQQLCLLPADASWFNIKHEKPTIMCTRLIAADALLCTGDNIGDPSTRWPDGTSKLDALQAILAGEPYA